MKIVIMGLSITSAWGNGHATTYRALVRQLVRRGHEVVFFERDVPWYAENRDLAPDECEARVIFYHSLAGLKKHHALARSADAVIIGSYVPQGIAVCDWVMGTAEGIRVFYDIDTPVTLARVEVGGCAYINARLIPRFDLYLSFAGGKTLTRLENRYGAKRARAFYCSVDPTQYYPEPHPLRWDLGYLGTYSHDRQPGLIRLLIQPACTWQAGSFVVAGPQYPDGLAWPPNVERIQHLAPPRHRRFYNSQRCTLNLTRSDMVAAGHSPSVRLFEAAACGTPIISDWWEGLDDFFDVGSEILVARDGEDVLEFLRGMSSEQLAGIGAAGRRRVLEGHTAAQRAIELENYLDEVRGVRQLATSHV